MNFPGCDDLDKVQAIIRRQALCFLQISSPDELRLHDYLPGEPDVLCNELTQWLAANDGLFCVKAWNNDANLERATRRAAHPRHQVFTWRMMGFKSATTQMAAGGVPGTQEERKREGYSEREYQQALQLQAIQQTLVQLQQSVTDQAEYIEELEEELDGDGEEPALNGQPANPDPLFKMTPWAPQDFKDLFLMLRTQQATPAAKLAGPAAAPAEDELMRAIARAKQYAPEEAKVMIAQVMDHFGDAAFAKAMEGQPSDNGTPQQ